MRMQTGENGKEVQVKSRVQWSVVSHDVEVKLASEARPTASLRMTLDEAEVMIARLQNAIAEGKRWDRAELKHGG